LFRQCDGFCVVELYQQCEFVAWWNCSGSVMFFA
jgi:hypothetical protein